MNTSQDTPNTVITLEMICQQKAEKLAEIRASKAKLKQTATE